MYSTKILGKLGHQSMGNSTLLDSGSVNDMLEIPRLIILLSTEYGTYKDKYRYSTYYTTDPWNGGGCNFPFLNSV